MGGQLFDLLNMDPVQFPPPRGQRYPYGAQILGIGLSFQTYIDIFVLLGSFLGHGLKFLGEIPEYDNFMHVMAGGIVVFIGAEVLKAFKGHESIPAGIKTFCGVGFSFIIIVAWELMEFFALSGSSSQIVPASLLIV